jgi:microcin C transport system substrate-binding protein
MTNRMYNRTHPIILFFGCALLSLTAFASTVTVSHGISVFGDLKYPKDFDHFSYVNPNAPKGGALKLASVGTFDNLNPFILKGVAADGTNLLFDTLMTGAADEASAEYGLIAESVEMPDTKEWIIFNLRSIATWHDGVPITADDVVFSFETLLREGHPQYQLYYQDVEKVEALSPSRVKFTFKNTTNRELPLLVGQLPILPKHYYQSHTFNETTLTPPLGSGPYRISAVVAGRSVTYERIKNYWAWKLPILKGRYNFDTVRYDYYRDDTVAVEALKAGEYDFRKENISKTWTKAYNIPHITDGRMTKEQLVDGTPTGMQAFVFNLREKKFQDPRVREALNYAYDFEWANKQLFFSAYTRNISFFGNSEYESSGLPSTQELALLEPFRNSLPARLFSEPYRPITTLGDGNNRPNLIKAQQLLNDAGWFIRDLKRIDPTTGQQATIEFLLSSSSFERIIAPYARNLKILGIESTIRTVDSSQYIKRLENFDFDITTHWFIQGSTPGNEEYNYWHSKAADQKGTQNIAGIKNPAVDHLVKHIMASTSKEELATAAHALDRILLWNFYVIPQWHSRTHRVIYWNTLARPAVTPPYSLSLVDTWWSRETQ